MAGEAPEYTAGIQTFVATVLVDHPRLGRVRMNAESYDPVTCGPVVEPPTQPPCARGCADPALKNPKVDEHGNALADQHSPMHRA